jgi:hypothetical protein
LNSQPTARDLAEFHDAELHKIIMDRKENSLILVFELDTGAKKEIRFDKVFAYKISDIYFQNVVSRLLLSSAGTMDVSNIDHALGLIFDRRPAGQPNFPETVKMDILKQELLLFYLDPSVGAEAAVAAKGVLIT